MTSTSSVIGTAQYLSPEQGRGEQVDARSDLYSAGCLLFELLTGRAPFVGDSPVSVVYQHVREEPIPPSQIDPEISPAIDAVVLKALRKDRDERYQTAAEMRDDLLRAREGRPVQAAALEATQALRTFLPYRSPRWPRPPSPPHRSPTRGRPAPNGPGCTPCLRWPSWRCFCWRRSPSAGSWVTGVATRRRCPTSRA
jgi:serine/threonine-protein kinase